MPEVLEVHSDLVLASRFEFQLHQRVGVVGAQDTVVRDGEFSPVVRGRRVGDVCLVVFQVTLHRPLLLFHDSRGESNVASVGDNLAPVVFQNLLRFQGLRIDQQARGVAVQTMHHVCRAALPRFPEIVVQHLLHAENRGRRRHGKNAHRLLHHDDGSVLIDNLHEGRFEFVARFALGDFHHHAGLQRVVMAGHVAAVHLHAPAAENRFGAGVADALHDVEDERQEFGGFSNGVGRRGGLVEVSHIYNIRSM